MKGGSVRWVAVATGFADLLLMVLLLQILSSASGAGPKPLAASSAGPETLSLKVETPHVRVMGDRAPAARLRQIAETLEAEYPRIAADLGGSDLRVITAVVWADAASFHRAIESAIGRRIEVATGYVSGSADLTILDGTHAASRAVHELVHCVTLRVNGTAGNNPRWLWETVAAYENGELNDPRLLPYLREGSYPTLAQLNGDSGGARRVYELGYVLGEFIATRFGRDALVRLVQANGDIQRVLGIDVDEFERLWHAFLEQKYLAPENRNRAAGKLARLSDAANARR